jgi:uncharacterized cupredoxin-like copper-binding protein
MRRFLVTIAAIACGLGAAAFVAAQSGTPSAMPGATTCASPVASPVASPPEEGTPPTCGAATAISLEMVDLAFRPAELTAAANTPVTVTLRSHGVALHNFSVDALDVSQDVLPGYTVTFTIQGPPGDYRFYCAIPGHAQAGMVGVLYLR